ncbi:MAG: hypothetical protein LBE39_03365 [Flavobacteriaceae bacterium]|jgi:hypothetical protein|nr:hypothetical protein [Flavobacteriaceae bacterium]
MNKLIYVFLLFSLYSCIENKKKESHLNGFDISPDAENIVFSYKKDSLYRIYTKSINDGKKSVIFEGSGNYVNPKYVNNGKTIVALYYPYNTLIPEFHFYNLATHKLSKKIKLGEGFISDYILSTSNKMFYLQAKTFQSYSPIVPKAYHDFDIYELDLVTLEYKRISNLKAYSMQEILNMEGDSLLVSMQGKYSDESGLFFVNKVSSMKEEGILNKIWIKNDTLRNSTMYANPVILPNNQILCASSYQMVMLDLKSNKEFPVLPSNGYHYNIIRNVNNLVFYQRSDRTDDIYFFNLKDKNINLIKIVSDKD